MPKRKKPKRSFDASPGSDLDGLRLVQQRPARPAQPGSDRPKPVEDPLDAKSPNPEHELVEKLINFFKSI